MTRFAVVLAALAMMLMAALPAAAQQVPVPYEEVAPVVVERPLVPPRIIADQPPAAVDVPREAAPPAVGVTAPAPAQVPGLAVTGLELNVGLALALGLVLAGVGALVLAAYRERRAFA